MAERIFKRKGSYEKYSLVERRDLGLKVKEFNHKYLLELEVIFLTPLPLFQPPPLLLLFFGKVSNPPIILNPPIIRYSRVCLIWS